MPIIIRLQNLPVTANAANIRRFFTGLSIPEGGVHIVGGNDGDAFIAFSQEDDARRAMLLDNQAINGVNIRLFLSSKNEMKAVIESARNIALFGTSISGPVVNTQTQPKINDIKLQVQQESSPQQKYVSDAAQNLTAKSALGYNNMFDYDDQKLDRSSERTINVQDNVDRPDHFSQGQHTSQFQSVVDSHNSRIPDRPVVPASESRPPAYGNYNFSSQPMHNYDLIPAKPTQVSENPHQPQQLEAPQPRWDQNRYQVPFGYENSVANRSEGYANQPVVSQNQREQDNPAVVNHNADYDRRVVPVPQSRSIMDQEAPYGQQPQLSRHPPNVAVKPESSQIPFQPPDVNSGYSNHYSGENPQRTRPTPGYDDRNYGYPHQAVQYASNQTSQQPPQNESYYQRHPDQASNKYLDHLPVETRSHQSSHTKDAYGPPLDQPAYGPPYHEDSKFGYGDRHEFGRVQQQYSRYDDRYSGDKEYKGHEANAYENNNHLHVPVSQQRSMQQIYPQSGQGQSSERDFTVKPPWLVEDSARSKRAPSQAPLAAYSNQHYDENDEFGPKRKRTGSQDVMSCKQPDNLSAEDTPYIVRLSFDPVDVLVRHVFDVLKSIQIVPRFGIRIDEDRQRRPTGYVFVMLTSREMLDRALALNHAYIRDRRVGIDSANAEDFYRVRDSAFASKAPPELVRKAQQIAAEKPPPHHDDGCLELLNLPRDVAADEVCSFLGPPGLTPRHVLLLSSSKGSSYSRAAVRLPSANDLQILMSAKTRPFRPNDDSLPSAELLPISRLQYRVYADASDSKRSSHPRSSSDAISTASTTAIAESDRRSANESSSSHPNAKITSPSKPPPSVVVTNSSASKESPVSLQASGPKVCLYISGFASALKPVDVLGMIKSCLIPGNCVHIEPPARRSAYVDLLSVANCQRATLELLGEDKKGDSAGSEKLTPAKQAHPELKVEAMSRAEMEKRIESFAKQTENSTEESRTHLCDDPFDTTPPISSVAGQSRHYQATNSGQHNYSGNRTGFSGTHSSVGQTTQSRNPIYRSGSGPNSGPNDHFSQHHPFPGDGGQDAPWGRSGTPTRGGFTNGGPPTSYNHFSGSRGGPPYAHHHSSTGAHGSEMEIAESSGSVGGPSSRVIYIGRMRPGTPANRVSEFLYGYRHQLNDIRMKRGPPNGQLTGDAMITMETPSDAMRAVRELNQKRMDGRPVTVQFEPI